ncbi:hypothetical protein [Flavobacteriaceae bacterium 14752]|uniref:hypothetical protein n=1 Tax=Mesohalobacter salilacus TaxID=2491711 RepID=UPI000F62C38E|nr:hypothetical protein EIG84_00975 [Flavobacteriaceae bacterium 14752]
MRSLVICFISILCLACSQNQNSLTYFGGGIVNPKDDFVLLMKQNEIIDSISVDNKGHFSYQFNLKKPDLFTFKHGYEYQMVYIEPKDSIMLRLNTLDFDESLVFGGTSAVENNFLIENYLLNQKNSELILSYYKISPQDFQFKTDSIKTSRENRLSKLKEKHNLSDEFVTIAQKSIDFEFYDMRERYAFLMNKYNQKKAKNIANDFYSYRKKIDFQNQNTSNLFGYQRFLDNYLKNLSIEQCQKNHDSKDCYNLNTYNNLDQRISLVDSLIHDKNLRKRYLERFIQEEIIYAETKKHLKHTSKLIEKYNFSEVEKKRLNSLVNFQSSLIVNADLKNVKIRSQDFKKHVLEDVMKKNLSVIYSWSVQSPSHHKLRIKKIKELKAKYPKIQFIGINIDHNFPDKWLDAVNKYNSNLDNEFMIVAEEHAPFYRNYLNKVFFLNKDCIIQKSEIILSNVDFDKHIEDFIASQ